MDLTKWYIDLVTPQGEAVIGYHVLVRMGPMRLACARVDVYAQDSGEARSRFSCRASHLVPPELAGSLVRWDLPALGLKATAEARARARAIELMQSTPGALRWWPIAPSASVSISLDNQSFQGSGYIERLDVRTRLSRLPLDSLRWGRWIGDAGGSLVWIRWDGPKPLTVLLDAEKRVEGHVLDNAIEFADSKLLIEDTKELRNGPLQDTVLARTHGIWRWISRPLRTWREVKWLGQASLADGSDHGWVIHERVDLQGPKA